LTRTEASVTESRNLCGRRFELPSDADGEHVRAEYSKSVLIAHVPKTVHEQPRKVEITKA
jgi:HSP20 family molecular chaperone IbpA